MRISARCDYACKALLELAMHWPDASPLHIHVISERQDIPMRYLVQILIQLKRMGLVVSARGKQGGYLLAKAPSEITLAEVLRDMSGPLLPLADSAVKNGSVFLGVWREVEGVMTGMLDKVNFRDISEKAKGAKGAIFYQI